MKLKLMNLLKSQPIGLEETEFSGMQLTTGTTSSINHYQIVMIMLDCKISGLPWCICNLGSFGLLRSVGGIVTDVLGQFTFKGPQEQEQLQPTRRTNREP
jgi:hypothetical protein